MFAQPYQFRLINRGENPSRTYRVRPAASVLPQTFRRVAGKELLKFSRESHGKTMQKRGASTQGSDVVAARKPVTPLCLLESDQSSLRVS